MHFGTSNYPGCSLLLVNVLHSAQESHPLHSGLRAPLCPLPQEGAAEKVTEVSSHGIIFKFQK